MKKRRFFRRAFAIAALATLASANAFGLSTKYFKTEVTAATGGQVYASLNYVKPADNSYASTSNTGSVTDSVSYDMNGRQVTNTQLRKGVYVKNGKKIVIR